MRKLIAAILLLTLVLSVGAPASALSPAVQHTYSKEANSGIRHEICTDLYGTSVDTYYTDGYLYDELMALSGEELLQTLRTLLTDTHTYQTSYDECRDLAVITDCENGDGTSINLLYSSFVTDMQGYINNTKKGWNREHVWPKSLGGFNTSGAGSDLHHIRPTDSSLNGTRGNDKYGNVEGGTEMYGTVVTNGAHGGKKGGSLMEPLDNVKGDVARICLYVYIRYGGELSKCSSITNVFESIETLLQWHAMDPVDTWEMGRNEVVYGIQGNRNVFIDYPELAWQIFGREVPEDYVTPSGSNSCEHLNTQVQDLDPTCTADGFVAGTVCSDCGKVVATGTVVPATGHQNVESRNQKDATCAEEGHTGDMYCTDCGELVAAGSVIPTTDHLHTEIRNAWDAVCNMAGNSGDVYCVDCNKLVKLGNLIPATGEHKFGQWLVAPGGGTQTRTCSVCNFEETQPADNTPSPLMGPAIICIAAAAIVVLGGGTTAVILLLKKKKV